MVFGKPFWAAPETLPRGERGWGRGNAIRQGLGAARSVARTRPCLMGLPEGEGCAFTLLRSGVWPAKPQANMAQGQRPPAPVIVTRMGGSARTPASMNKEGAVARNETQRRLLDQFAGVCGVLGVGWRASRNLERDGASMGRGRGYINPHFPSRSLNWLQTKF